MFEKKNSRFFLTNQNQREQTSALLLSILTNSRQLVYFRIFMLSFKQNPEMELQYFDKQAFQGAKVFFYTFNSSTLILFLYNTQFRSIVETLLITTVFILNVIVYKKCNSTKSFVDESSDTSQNSSRATLEETQSYPQYHQCRHCHKLRGYRIKHCSKCGHCIYKFDHHCFWIGNCVGQTNHHYFYYFLFTQTILNVMFIEVYYSLMSMSGWGMMMFGMFLLNAGFIMFTGYLLLYHTFLLLTAQTTWEHMRRPYISYMKHLPIGYNPFSKGIVKNIYEFFCGKHEPKQYKPPQKVGSTFAIMNIIVVADVGNMKMIKYNLYYVSLNSVGPLCQIPQWRIIYGPPINQFTYYRSGTSRYLFQ